MHERIAEVRARRRRARHVGPRDEASRAGEALGRRGVAKRAANALRAVAFAGMFAIAWTGCDADRPGPDADPGPAAGWPHYGGDRGGMRHSVATQISPANVDRLEVAWVHHSGDVSDGSDGTSRTSFNVTPLLVGDALVYCTPMNRVLAIDAQTGEQRWAYDPQQRQTKLPDPHSRVCRGVAFWEAEDAEEREQRCGRRIFTATIDAELIAIDAATGLVCGDFGDAGRVDLRAGMGAIEDWAYYVTSPPTTVNDTVVVGGMVYDNLRRAAPPGVVRGYDVRTGKRRWGFDPVPPGYAGPPPAEGSEFVAGTANSWSIASADESLDLVYVPMGNAATDYFASSRFGLDHFSSSVVALRGGTGELVWHYRMVNKDVWDFDTASQPVLFDFEHPDGSRVPALAQATKMGHVFLLDRRTGRPIHGHREQPVPTDGVPGEELAPTQPVPTFVAPLHPSELKPDDAFGFTFWDRGRCREALARYRYDGIFTPPTVEGSIQFPQNPGGMNWGSVAIDPERRLLVTNLMRMANGIQLIPRAEWDAMPDKASHWPFQLQPMHGTPWAMKNFPILSPFGAPCSPPPWGTLVAVDLATGEIAWEKPLGTIRDQAPFPIWLWPGFRNLGAPNLGGPVLTASGLVFIAATTDRYLRAFDSETGEELWRHRLPFTGNATPMTYRLGPDGRQFVVIAAGGHVWSEPGDALMAFALPR
ncbi:MAG: pyrroloquinoline quinone-dependent dehydrogenase [Myxococcota bacterium]